MSIELTEEQSKAIEQAGEQPPSVTDPRTRKNYVLLSADIFERMRLLLGDQYALSDTYHAQFDSAMKAGLG